MTLARSQDAPETLGLVIPPELVASNQPLTATFGGEGDAGLVIATQPGNATIRLVDDDLVTRARLRSPAELVIEIGLSGGERWQSSVGLNDVDCHVGARDCPSRALLDALQTAEATAESTGWDAIMGGAEHGLSPLALERIDDHRVRLRLWVPQGSSPTAVVPARARIGPCPCLQCTDIRASTHTRARTWFRFPSR